jgi:nucleoside-diphosphate-sugar epimerase
MIAVTGANGLLGKFIVRSLTEAGYDVVAITRKRTEFEDTRVRQRTADITDTFALTDALSDVTTVIHAAAIVSLNPAAKDKMHEVNVVGTQNLVNACLEMGIPRLIYISSVAAMSKPKGVSIIDENAKWIPGAHQPNYGESKYLAELEVYRGNEEGLQTCIISPSVILAIGDWNRSSARLFKFVWNEKPFYTEGQFNYVDVRDVCEMILTIIQKDLYGEKFIASAGSISFFDFFSKAADRLGKRKPFLKIPTRLVEWVATLDLWRTRVTGGEPFMDKKALRINREPFLYSNSKAKKILQIQFRTIDESLDWCCSAFASVNTTNI